ncbi:MAG: hypothetical protein HY699_15240 [Deltaproteobacteria bacterium]|nr:hypothetical protein [Deltaproteobacteria bacterium]
MAPLRGSIRSSASSPFHQDKASGECREVIQGTGDVEAIAAGPSCFPFRALRRGLETVIEDAVTAAPVARFPVPLDYSSTFPNGRA